MTDRIDTGNARCEDGEDDHCQLLGPETGGVAAVKVARHAARGNTAITLRIKGNDPPRSGIRAVLVPRPRLTRKIASAIISASEVVREALRLLEERDKLQAMKFEELRKEIQIGIDQADRGEVGRLDVKGTLAKVRHRRKDGNGVS